MDSPSFPLRCLARRLIPLLFVFGLSGCDEAADPLDRRIDAASASVYQRWTYQDRSAFGPALERRFKTALDHLALELSAADPGRRGAVRETAIRELLHGATVRQAIAYGELVHLHRLAVEELIDRITHAANMEQLRQVRPGSDRSITTSITNHLDEVERRRADRQIRIKEVETAIVDLLPALDLATWRPYVIHGDEWPALQVAHRCARAADLPLLP